MSKPAIGWPGAAEHSAASQLPQMNGPRKAASLDDDRIAARAGLAAADVAVVVPVPVLGDIDFAHVGVGIVDELHAEALDARPQRCVVAPAVVVPSLRCRFTRELRAEGTVGRTALIACVSGKVADVSRG